MEKILQSIRLLLHEEKIIKKEKERRGENYNIFEVMHAESDEVYTHSAVIASLLNPMGHHGCKTTFLDMFINKVHEMTIQLYDYTFINHFKNCNVFVEYYIGEIISNSESGGRIDILIESADHSKAVIIENKIYAADQKKQLYRYKKYAIDKYGERNHIILYLTLDGHKPSNNSIKGNDFSMVENKDYYCISYRHFIFSWLELCKEKSSSIPLVRETITQYYNLIAKLTHQNMETSTKDKLINSLSNKENIDAVFTINNVYVDVLNNICKTTLVKQAQEIADELNLILRHSTKNWCVRWEGQLFFYKPEWKYFCIAFEFMGNNLTDFNYGIRYKSIEAKKAMPESRNDIISKLNGKSGEWWPYFTPFNPRNWNNSKAMELLYEEKIKDRIKICIIDILKRIEDIDL